MTNVWPTKQSTGDNALSYGTWMI